MYQQQLQFAASAQMTSNEPENHYGSGVQQYEQQGGNGHYDVYVETPENENFVGGVLSRKVSLKHPNKQSTYTEAKKIVSPESHQYTPNDSKKVEVVAKPLNPFAVNKTGQTPQKRTASVLENLESPSPKKPVLNVSCPSLH
jgi:hypothetical protein